MNFTTKRANPDQHYDALATFLNHFEPARVRPVRQWDGGAEGR